MQAKDAVTLILAMLLQHKFGREAHTKLFWPSVATRRNELRAPVMIPAIAPQHDLFDAIELAFSFQRVQESADGVRCVEPTLFYDWAEESVMLWNPEMLAPDIAQVD